MLLLRKTRSARDSSGSEAVHRLVEIELGSVGFLFLPVAPDAHLIRWLSQLATTVQNYAAAE
jgi:hypothetical protein